MALTQQGITSRGGRHLRLPLRGLEGVPGLPGESQDALPLATRMET